MTTLWVCRYLVTNGGSPLARHHSWRALARLTASDGGVMEHGRACRALESLACFDQANLPDLATAELLARSIQMQEERYRDRFSPDEGSYVDSHLFLGTAAVRGNVCVSPELQSFVPQELAKEYSVAKERRKAHEERQAARQPRGKAKAKGKAGGRGGGGDDEHIS